MGLTGLESLPEFVEHNRRNYYQYREALSKVTGITLLAHNEVESGNFQYIVLEIDSEATRIDRDQLVKVLHAENVLARRYFHPGCHRMEPYRTEDPGAGSRLPVTERLADRVLVLPTGPALKPSDIDQVCALVRLAVTHAEELERLAA